MVGGCFIVLAGWQVGIRLNWLLLWGSSCPLVLSPSEGVTLGAESGCCSTLPKTGIFVALTSR